MIGPINHYALQHEFICLNLLINNEQQKQFTIIRKVIKIGQHNKLKTPKG